MASSSSSPSPSPPPSTSSPPPPVQPQVETETETEWEWEWDIKFQCPKRKSDGVLFPKPLRCVYPPAPAPAPASQEAGPSAPAEQPRHEEQPPQPAIQCNGRWKKSLVASHILAKRIFSFQLFHCKETQENFLGMTEDGTTDIIYYALKPCEKKQKKKLDAKEIHNIGQREISPVDGEIYEIADDKCKLSLQQRLEGKWTIELRRRNETMKSERFYLHEKVNRTFRSMNEVATFIGYNVIY